MPIKYKPPVQAEPEPETPQEDPGFIKKYAPSAIRGIAGFAGFTPITGALAGGVGETLAQMVEQGSIDPRKLSGKRIAAETAVGAAMGKYAKALQGLVKGGKVGLAALKGGTYGASAPVIRHAVEEGEMAPLSEIATSGAIGAATGGGTAKLFGSIGRGSKGPLSIDPRKIVDDVVPPTTPPPAATTNPLTKTYTAVDPSPEALAAQKKIKGQSGLRVALDQLEKAKQQPHTVTTPEEIAAHRALAANQARDPKGAISKAIGPPVEPLSLVDQAKLADEVASMRAKDAISTEKSHGVALKEKVDVAKAHETANKMVAKEASDTAKAQTKYVEDAAKQEARNLNTADKYRRGVEKAADQADIEDARRTAQGVAQSEAERQAKEIERLRGTLTVEKQPSVMTETVTGPGKHGGKAKATFARVAEEAEEGAKSASKAGKYEAELPPPRDQVEGTIYSSLDRAKKDAEAYGGLAKGIQIERIGNRQYRIRLPKGIESPALPPAPKTPLGPAAQKFQDKVDDIVNRSGGPDEPPPVPSGPKPRTPKGGGGSGVVVDKQKLHGKRMSKKEAEDLVQLTGEGRVYQFGPKKYTVLFDDVAEEIEAHRKAAAPTEPVAVPKEPSVPFRPATPLDPTPIQTGTSHLGGLTPDEFRRYMNIAPGQGVKRTAEEIAEWKALHAKKTGQELPKQVEPKLLETPIDKAADRPVGKAAKDVAERRAVNQGPPPGVSERRYNELLSKFGGKAKPEGKPLTVEEFAQELSKEGSKPIAEVPFSLSSEAAKPKGVTEGLFAKTLQDALAERTTKAASKAPGAAPIRVFKSPLEAAGENYGAIKAARAAGEKVPEEGRAAAGRAAQRLNKEAGGKPTPKPTAPSKADSPDWVAEQLKEVEKLAKGKGKGKSKGITLSAMGAGQLGDIWEAASNNPEFAAKLIGTLGGGLIGASMDDENPVSGALIGAGVGFAGGSAASKLPGLIKSGQTIKEMTDPIVSRIPNWQRGALLSDPRSIVNNSFLGPWGANLLGGVEQSAKGVVNRDPAQLESGKEALKAAAHIPSWLRGWGESLMEASQKIDDLEELGRAGRFYNPDNPNAMDRLVKYPATLMLAGDLNVRNNLINKANMPEDLARRITLTSEPRRALWKNVANFGKAKAGELDEGDPSTIAQILLPFKRTAANILESGTERTPILGSLINHWGDESLKIPFREQLVQQGIGGVVLGLGYAVGSNVDQDTNRTFKIQSAISNLGGQYSLLANLGFMAGQAVKSGKMSPELSMRSAIEMSTYLGQRMAMEMPLPSTEPVTQMLSPLRKVAKGEDLKITEEAKKSSLYPKILNFVESETGSEPGSITKYMSKGSGGQRGSTRPRPRIPVESRPRPRRPARQDESRPRPRPRREN